MKRTITVLALAGAVVTLAATAVPASATPSTQAPNSALAGCYNTGCNGRDPIDQGCTDAITTYSLSTSLGRLEHRYSSTCNASWARITGASAGTWFYVQTCYGPYVQTYNVPSSYASAYTDMVPGRDNIRVGNAVNHGPC
ncbi:DUF2690 domain-containing protein [Sphaerimonospora cavernae]|uniref:DUF2690 domain-containing protein n=1 Tax=Sphaerimonospora cavernae TaxID=1740611 RepID=A0ABV6U1Z5_9ACTN